MKIEKQNLNEDTERDLYWGRIYFTSEDGLKKSKILFCGSTEYLQQRFGKDRPQKDDFKPWVDQIIKKWETLESNIFNQDIHYDVYAATKEGEANGIDFLLEKSKS